MSAVSREKTKNFERHIHVLKGYKASSKISPVRGRSMDVSCQLDAPTGLYPKDVSLGSHWKGGRLRLRAGLDMANIIPGSAGNRIPFVGPVVSELSHLTKT